VQRLYELIRYVLHEVQRHAGLHLDGRKAVRDDIVQLARDAQSFLGDGSTTQLILVDVLDPRSRRRKLNDVRCRGHRPASR
jgi:hypothetical protein